MSKASPGNCVGLLLTCGVVALALTGCGAERTKDSISPAGMHGEHAAHSELHALYVDSKGYATSEELWTAGFLDTRTWHAAERNSADENDRISAIVGNLKHELAKCETSRGTERGIKSRGVSNRKEVLIFIHGGLNSNKKSYARTKNLLGKTDIASDCRYPIFINWRSGPFVSYKDHLIRVRQGKNGGFPAKVTAPLYLLTDLAQAIVGAPKAWMTQGMHNYRTNFKKDFSDYDRLKPCGPGAGYACKATKSFDCETCSNDRTKRMAIWWASTPLKAAITPLVFDIGKPSWDVMLHRTNMLLWKECAFNGSCSKNNPPGPNDGLGLGPLSKLIREISKIKNLESDYEITLVGHSMGTIVINRIVSTLPELPIENIVFLGAADSIRNTQYGALQFIAAPGHSDARFYSWMLHPDNESRELAKLGMAPSGSLLTWIDNMFSNPDSLLDYRFGRWDSIKELPEVFTNRVKARTRLMVFGRDDLHAPHEHGDFGHCKFWQLDEIESSFTSAKN